MKLISALASIAILTAIPSQGMAQNNFEGNFTRPLSDVLNDISRRFNVRLKYDIDTVGKKLPYADSRIRPYSVEESLTNVLSPFDYKFVFQSPGVYKLKRYEYPRRTTADGRKLIDWLSSLYNDRSSWEARRDSLIPEVRRILTLDEVLDARIGAEPVMGKVRKYDGYTVQNFSLETVKGRHVCGSIYSPASKGQHPLIICPNGHFSDGRYNEAIQQRLATLARMGAVCVSYDLYGWGESADEVGSQAHQTSEAHVMQIANGISILDFMLKRKDIDNTRVGVNGGSGGGTQTVVLAALDPRFTAACPVISLSSYFDGGCPCESGKPITLAGSGTCNAELAATFAPKPLMVVSDGKDWTQNVPELEYPYLQSVYSFYGAPEKVMNRHYPQEGHDFGFNKRKAVYDFFIETFGLDPSRLDESKVTIETPDQLKQR